MSTDVLLIFGATSFLITASPWPIILYAVHAALDRGMSVAWVILPAILLGDASAMALSLLGVGALVASMPSVYLPLQLSGAAILIFIGLQNLRKAGAPAAGPADNETASGRFWPAYLLAALHPGAFIFYAAFFPQFIDSAHSIAIQVSTFSFIFLFSAACSILIWIAFASAIKGSIFVGI